MRLCSDRAIAGYLRVHPDSIVDSVKAYREAANVEQQRAINESVAENVTTLEHDPLSPIGGNVSGTKVAIEFFDYQCPYCKGIAKTLDDFLISDAQAKIIYKEFPILGNESALAARASLASYKLGNYDVFHHALLRNKEPLSVDRIRQIASDVGISWQELSAAMSNPDIDTELERTKELAQKLNIKGTPSFVVAGKYVDSPFRNKEEMLSLFVATSRNK